ncbi:LPXTG-motif cell wall anchor domain protein [Coriobacterium glomerans PW2]|uniref:LPXTG-motif cell wall anchor domain protein n=1 Tax=Coriobacterium glomerans (strain ATCC 49209 / DSM 20642 / JCM 10262 / PW2) TaxID=700015 RepID=F2NA92_CORGP|nr:SpaH/EbpB family LPXTG-anchored major pilin [Coriobacterium glomerans]AEB06278.1 LPXTG-motif cell wall anchor domain protein [Coriobacterium glomerans PW2]
MNRSKRTNRFRPPIKIILSLLAAALFALAIGPSVAQAAPQPFAGNKLTVTNLHKFDTVSIYRIVTISVDPQTNVQSYEFTADFGITKAQWERDAKDATNLQADANKIAQYVHDNDGSQALDKKSKNSPGESVEFDGLYAGQYLVVVTNEDDLTRVFQNTVVSVLPAKQADGSFAPANVSAAIKFTDLSGTGVNKLVNGKKWEDRIDNGDTAKFTITSVIPQYADPSTRTFMFSDSMTMGLDYQHDLKVAAGTTELTLGTDYAIGDKVNFFHTITILPSALGKYANQPITITYSAKFVTTGNRPVYARAESNTVYLKFSPNSVGANADDEIKIVSSNVSITIYGLHLKKISSTDGHALAGAEFSVRAPGGAEVATAKTDAQGNVNIVGALAAQKDYTLKETKAPAGYAPVADMHFTIESRLVQDYKGYQYDLGNIKDTPTGFDTLLPTTGGPGTIAVTAVGVFIVAGTAAWIIRSRRRRDVPTA